MANALLALVSNSRNVNPYFAICQKTISGATSRWSFFLPFWAVYSRGVRVGGRLFAQLTTCREDLSNKPFSRECWGSSYCPLGNTGSWSPYFAFAQYGLHLRLCARAGALARIRLRPPPQTPPPRGGAQIPCRFRASRSNPQQRRALSKGSTLQSLHYYMVIS